MTTTKLTPPPALDNSKLHSREEIRAWEDACYQYRVAIRAEEQREATAAAAKAAEANRMLTEDEYRAAAVIREAERQARQAAREAEEKAVHDAKEAYLASSPEVAEVAASNPHHYTMLVCHWANRGYTFPEDGDVIAFPNHYEVRLLAPATPALAKKAK